MVMLDLFLADTSLICQLTRATVRWFLLMRWLSSGFAGALAYLSLVVI